MIPDHQVWIKSALTDCSKGDLVQYIDMNIHALWLKVDKPMIMRSRAEKDTARHSTVQNGTARVSTHDSTTDVCAGVGVWGEARVKGLEGWAQSGPLVL